jgi:hypothetical protein
MFFRVVRVVRALPGPADPGVQGKIPGVDGKAVAELVSRLVKEELDVFHRIFVTAGVAAPILQGCADFLNRKGRLIIRAGDICALHGMKVVGVEFRPDTVQNFAWITDDCHNLLLCLLEYEKNLRPWGKLGVCSALRTDLSPEFRLTPGVYEKRFR